MLLCHPSLGNWKICRHRPHYAALSLLYAVLGAPALWQHNTNLRQHNFTLGWHNLSLGHHIFPYPLRRGGIIYHTAGPSAAQLPICHP